VPEEFPSVKGSSLPLTVRASNNGVHVVPLLLPKMLYAALVAEIRPTAPKLRPHHSRVGDSRLDAGKTIKRSRRAIEARQRQFQTIAQRKGTRTALASANNRYL
jgi:hypothetical protein